jgi:ArsR family transcriptional regulator
VRSDLFGRESSLRPLLALVDPAWVVGDLGCGTGQVSEALAPFVRSVVAVDDSREMLDAARLRLKPHKNVTVRRSALERLPFEDAELDAAIIVLVLHYIADPGRALSEAARALRAGGRLLVADMLPHDHDEYRQTMGHVWLGFSKRQLEKWLTAAGLESMRWHSLPVEQGVKGPGLFVVTAVKSPSYGNSMREGRLSPVAGR